MVQWWLLKPREPVAVVAAVAIADAAAQVVATAAVVEPVGAWPVSVAAVVATVAIVAAVVASTRQLRGLSLAHCHPQTSSVWNLWIVRPPLLASTIAAIN